VEKVWGENSGESEKPLTAKGAKEDAKGAENINRCPLQFMGEEILVETPVS
jgi:hypothetical protein